FRFNDREPGGVFEQPEVLGRKGGQYLALGVSSLYDTRNNTTYTTNGFYSRIKYAYAPRFWGDDNFVGSQLEADVRGFHALSSQITLAGQVLYRGTFGRSEEHTSELQSRENLVCRLLHEKKKLIRVVRLIS